MFESLLVSADDSRYGSAVRIQNKEVVANESLILVALVLFLHLVAELNSSFALLRLQKAND